MKKSTVTTTSTTNALLGAGLKANSKNQAIINVTQQKEQQQAILAGKKKRVALENISNAALTTSNNSNTMTNNSLQKKSRFGTTTTVVPNTLLNKKLEVPVVARKAKSKENLVGPVPFTKLNKPQAKKPEEVLQKETNEINNQLATTTISVDANKKDAKNETQSIEMDVPQHQFMMPVQADKLTQLKHVEELNELNESLRKLNADLVECWEDIDKNDVDEFNCSDYVASIFKYYRERENQFLIDDYLSKKKTSINKAMRALLVDWMVEVQQQLEFNHEVLYLSVKLLDLYLNDRVIEKERLQLLGGAAMFIACKFEERMPPIIDDFIYVSDNAYDRHDLIKMEIEILKTVRFDIGIPLAYTFLRRYSKCIRADMRFLTLARYILELSLQEYEFCYIKDSLKACAALYLAMRMTHLYELRLAKNNGSSPSSSPTTPILTTTNLTSVEWNGTLVHYTNSFLSDFIQYVPMMNRLVVAAPSAKHKTIFKKYSHPVFYEVAKVPALNGAELDQLVENAPRVDNQVFEASN